MTALALVAIALGMLVAPARSRAHMAAKDMVASQNYVTHPDATIAATASPTPALQANANRVTARCQNTGATNTLRVGDANIGASQGTVLYPAAASSPIFPNTIDIDTTAAVYFYSQSGTTAHCDEITR